MSFSTTFQSALNTLRSLPIIGNRSAFPRGRDLQLRLDAARLFTIIQSSSHYAYNSTYDPGLFDEMTASPCPDQRVIADMLNVSQLPSLQFQAAVLKLHFLRSTRHILQITHDAIVTRTGLTSKHHVENYVKQQVGFVPIVNQSEIPHAGRGVFVDGIVNPGTVVALYPGTSYLPSQLRVSQRKLKTSVQENGDDDEQGKDNDRQQYDDNKDALPPTFTEEQLDLNEKDLSDYMIARYDGVVIDGAVEVSMNLDDLLTNHNTNTNNHNNPSSSSSSSSVEISHPFANAHLVNHPSSQQHPNVLQFMIDIDTASLGPKLAGLVPVNPCDVHVGTFDHYENLASRQRVPNSHHFIHKKNGTARGNDGIFRTVALVATRKIENEELFMDYRFNPKVNPPDWYTPCGEGVDASRRWFARGAFHLN